MLRFDGLDCNLAPAITKHGYADLEDDPTNHRWRAWWSGTIDGRVTGIELRAYPVIKTNPQSVWISEDAQRCAGVWENHDPNWMRKRLCHDGASAAWAKPTQEEAIHSLAVRLTRWSNRLRSDVQKAVSAAETLKLLKPNEDWAANHAIEKLQSKK